ncbi:MAG: HAD family hydrolase [Planctomycetota bacterium]|nr:HAD family hydrolase [Planctomycetota bacterium]
MDALVFDFDGVIADSEHLHDEALRVVCEPLGFDWEGDAWVGWPDAEVFRELYRRRGERLSDRGLAELLERKTEAVLVQVRAGLYRVYPGSVELMRAAARVAKVGVCSAGLRGQIVPVLESFGALECVSTIVAYEDTPRSKPDPGPYLLAAERLGSRPGSSVAIEDSVRGVAAARGAGFRVVAVGHTTARERLGEATMFEPTIATLTVDRLMALVRAEDDGD